MYPPIKLNKRAKKPKAKTTTKAGRKQRSSWIENQRNSLMVVASLIAIMAFQVGVNPPGGAWQDTNYKHAGRSVLSDVSATTYDELIITCNTVALISSLSVILLLIGGVPCNRFFVGVLMVTLSIAVSATTLTYMKSVGSLTANEDSF